jgi:hypothetical protein
MESTFISNPPDPMVQQYILLLEKTNQQLSLWTNPYALMVATLSILFTLLTVIAAIIIWRQSNEQKLAFKAALQNYEENLHDNLKKIGGDAEQKIQLFIDQKTKDMETLSGDAKKQTKKLIDDLKKEKDSIGSRIQFSSVNTRPIQFGGSTSSVAGVFASGGGSGGIFSSVGGNGGYLVGQYCPNCGIYNNASAPVGNHLGAAGAAKFCSNCGHSL